MNWDGGVRPGYLSRCLAQATRAYDNCIHQINATEYARAKSWEGIAAYEVLRVLIGVLFNRKIKPPMLACEHNGPIGIGASWMDVEAGPDEPNYATFRISYYTLVVYTSYGVWENLHTTGRVTALDMSGESG